MLIVKEGSTLTEGDPYSASNAIYRIYLSLNYANVAVSINPYFYFFSTKIDSRVI
jgi:hypothetical protein